MKPMDFWCCGSIKNRGARRGMVGLKRWMRKRTKYVKYAAELDIYHFYESLKPEIVINRLNQLIKDEKIIELVKVLIKDKIPIGTYYSQWFANMVLTPLDHYIREQLKVKYYLRYMDNLTLLGPNKKKMHKAVKAISEYLQTLGLKLKSNWQVFKISARPIKALGYRYGKNYTLLKKENLLRTKRKLSKFYKDFKKEKISYKSAAGLISRLGMLKHCKSRAIKQKYVYRGTEKALKFIVKFGSLKI